MEKVCMYVCVCVSHPFSSKYSTSIFSKNRGSLLHNHSTVIKTRAFNVDTIISYAAHIPVCHLTQQCFLWQQIGFPFHETFSFR